MHMTRVGKTAQSFVPSLKGSGAYYIYRYELAAKCLHLVQNMGKHSQKILTIQQG